jgi:hypothetical protein
MERETWKEKKKKKKKEEEEEEEVKTLLYNLVNINSSI